MRNWSWLLAAAGATAAVAAAAGDPGSAGAAATQTWSAFVIVAGLLLIGLVAAEDGLFAAAGERLGRLRSGRTALLAGFSVLVMVVTALLNLDTSVAFLTPVAVHTGRRKGGDAAVLVSACLLLSNAGSLLLPGSNLTNLIVLGHLHMAGGRFVARMGVPWLAAGLVTAAVVAGWGRGLGSRRRSRPPRGAAEAASTPRRPVVGLGLAAVAAAVVVMLAVASPAPIVFGIGALAAAARLVVARIRWAQVWDVLGVPVLAGLFGLSVGLGALGRDWSAPARALSHLDPWATAAVGAGATIVINNLPAAALLSARAPAHPLSLLIGLNVGPNLFVSGSLAWVLWYKSARTSGGRPDVRRTVGMGLVSAPVALAAAVGALLLVGPHT